METVNLLLPLSVALLLSYSPAAAIRCNICTGFHCLNMNSFVQECGRNVKMCMSAHISVNGLSVQQWMACGEPTLCLKTGPQIASMTHKARALAQIDCCDTDNCNSKSPPAPSAPAAGALTCPDHQNNDIQCNALETSCFKTGDSGTDTYGCSSPNACADMVLSNYLLGLTVQEFQSKPKPVTCEAKPSAPPQCQMCLDHCCSKIIPFSAPSGSKCVAAIVKDSSGILTLRKAIASAPLCSLSLTKAFVVDETEVQVTCCDTDDCNTEVPEFEVSMTPEPVSPCHGPGCTDGLYEQVKQLIQSVPVLTNTCSTSSEVVQ